MPLNPNGKIDKPALPFPDTAEAASAETPHASGGARKLSPTESTLHDLWKKLLPAPPSTIPLDENFFDLGGHSILATRLVFEIRKTFIVDAPLGLIFDHPTLGGLASQIDGLRDVDFGLTRQVVAKTTEQKPASSAEPLADDYAEDLEVLVPQLAASYQALPTDFTTKKVTVFLTGATGFLGAFVLRDLLSRVDRVAKVICLVRASDEAKGMQRLREACEDRAIWDETWVSEGRLAAVPGDLGLERFGMDEKTWSNVAAEADAVLHNGAMVSKVGNDD